MALYDNAYSRFIAWAKIILPLIALALLSTMFLLSRQIGTTQTIPYSTVEVEQFAREQRIGAPNYSGVATNGAAVSVGAETAMPDPKDPQVMTGNALRARIETPEGVRFDMNAEAGTIDAGAQRVALSGGVVLRTSSGYEVRAEVINADLEAGAVVSDKPVSASGPLGSLDAGSMSLTTIKGSDDGYLLVFKGGVKLVYDPKE